MARKHKHEEHENHERWLVSYADFITLLFAFFVSMYAISNLDLQKAGRLVTSARAAFNYNPVLTGGRGALGGESAGLTPDTSQLVPPANPDGSPAADQGEAGASEGGTGSAGLDGLQQRIEQALEDEGLAGLVAVRRLGLELSITLSETLFFESGSAEIRPDALPTLDLIAAVLRASKRPMRIEGHTDSLPISTPRYPSNWELSTARATSILRHLVERKGFDPLRVAAAGYGPYRPTASNQTVEDRARNRRVEIVIVGEAVMPGPAAAAEPAPAAGGGA